MSVAPAPASPPSAPAPQRGELSAYLESPPPAIPARLDVSDVVDSAACVLVIQHSAAVPPAYLAYFLHQQDVPFHVLRIDAAGAALPPEGQKWLAVVSLGGPQGSYEEELHPWIAAEKRFLLAHSQAGTPVLGICLGCQLLADAVGGRVYAAPRDGFEVGYPPVRLTADGAKDPFLTNFFARLRDAGVDTEPPPSAATPAPAASAWAAELSTPSTAGLLMHHGDTFDLPSGVALLAQSRAYKQAFRSGSALAVQFHPEASVHEISQWTAFCPDRYPLVGTSAAEVVQLVKDRQRVARAHSRAFFEAWWESIGQTLKLDPEQ